MVSFSSLTYCSCICQGREGNPSLYIGLGGKPIAGKEGLSLRLPGWPFSPICASAASLWRSDCRATRKKPPLWATRVEVPDKNSHRRGRSKNSQKGLRSQIRILIGAGGRKTRRKNFRLDRESNGTWSSRISAGKRLTYWATDCSLIHSIVLANQLNS